MIKAQEIKKLFLVSLPITKLPVALREYKKPVLKRGPSGKLDFDTIKSALEKTGGNKSRAAKLLGAGRATLYRFLGEHLEILKHYRAHP